MHNLQQPHEVKSAKGGFPFLLTTSRVLWWGWGVRPRFSKEEIKMAILTKRSNSYMSLKHMKSLIVLVVGLLVVGCGKPEQPVNTYENKKRVGFLSHRTETKPVKELTPTDQNTTKAKPVKELTLEEKVVGEYEGKALGYIYRYVLLEDEISWLYENGKKHEWLKWSISNREIHVKYPLEWMEVYRINKDKSITVIAKIGKDGKRKDITNKKFQFTYKKIK